MASLQLAPGVLATVRAHIRHHGQRVTSVKQGPSGPEEQALLPTAVKVARSSEGPTAGPAR